MLNVDDLLQTAGGKGVINILAADKLMNAPKLYSTMLLWLLSELYERLPEVGDPEKPKLVFFFDEAHLLFNDAPKPLLDKIEQVVRLIRSKGVGVYFVTQNPLDVPETVLGQLGNRVQHALRAFTPRDQKAVKAAAETMRANPEARHRKGDHASSASAKRSISFLDEKGRPGMVERAFVLPPASRIGPVTPDERKRDDRGIAGRRHRTTRRSTANRRTSGCRDAPSRRAATGAPAPRRAPRRRWLPRLDQGLARWSHDGQRSQGQHGRGDGQERRAHRRLDGRPRDRPRRAGIPFGR